MELTKRESDQNEATISYFAEAIANGADIDPIVVIDDQILDGHHRYEAALQTGVTLTFSRITRSQYEALSAQFDDMEIAAAAHLANDNTEAAYNVANQFSFAITRAEAAASQI